MTDHKTVRKKALWLCKDLFDRFNKHEITQLGAQLAYFFLLSMFPFLIFINALIGEFNINSSVLQNVLEPFMHNAVTNVIVKYVEYISVNKSIGLLSIGVIVEIYSASNAVRALSFSMDRAFGVKPKNNPLINIFSSMVFTAFMAVIVLISILLMTVSQDLLRNLPTVLKFPKYTISLANIVFWIFIVIVLFMILLLTYRFTPHIRLKIRQIIPGTLFSLAGNILLTYGFSTYVSNSVKFSALYGSISSVLMLLLWMYFVGILIVLGAEINSSFIELRRER